ncbi:hypothetical protein A2191_04055 [Candidatus Woesebacteria bacterium RIFOXYA1_FULL_38_9]|nr:MAG: hypothetical protein A2191_04055 [Candidatus Woesebacteria bacterium RIFOXYA1_FULL_38_9]
MELYHGFICGSRTSGIGKIIWKIRIQDERSSHNGEKIEAISFLGAKDDDFHIGDTVVFRLVADTNHRLSASRVHKASLSHTK